MPATDQTIDTCNALLRDEITAIETYTQAIVKFDPDATDAVLESIRTDHRVNAFELHKLVSDSGVEPSDSSGAWNGFVRALENTTSLFGESPALKILQAGEENGFSQYKNALANTDVSEAAKMLIKRTLLPSLSGHLIELQQRRDRAA
jgi:hypothetical protein